MVYTLCYIFVFLAETFISLFYFENKFERKAKLKTLLALYALMCVMLYLVRLLNSAVLNVAAFLVCNFLILHLGYKTNLKSCAFHSCILMILMVITESIVLLASSAFLGTEIFVCFENSIDLIIQAAMSEAAYLLTVYLTLKFTTPESKTDNNILSLFLLILPVSSVLLMYVILCAIAKYDIENKFIILLLIGVVLMLLSNIVVFAIYEFTLKTNRKNLMLELERQKEQSKSQYYELLNRQNENTKIIIHDIKRHLNTIKALDTNEAVEKYIEKFIDDFSLDNPVDYCQNALVNVITNRYKTLCGENGIKFNIDIRNANMDFIDEPDTTALLDNLLENAFEAAQKSDKKFIDFSITTRDSKYLVVEVLNSTEKEVKIKHNRIASSKNIAGVHGVGLKSVKRVIRKYKGEANMNFNEDNMTFSASIVFEIPQGGK